MRHAAFSEMDFSTGGRPDQPENLVNPLPAIHRLALAEEIGVARHRRTGLKHVGRLQVRGGRVVDVDHVHQVRTVAHAPQLLRQGAIDQTWNEVVISGSPNQVRSQRTRRQARIIGGEHFLLRLRLGLRVVAQPALGYGADSSTPSCALPSNVTLGLDVNTRRRTPAARQAATTFRVPNTLIPKYSPHGPQMPAKAAV